MAHGFQHARRGAVMIVVLGLITILLSLVLGVTVKVYNGIKNGSNVTQNAQAWIMMQAARVYIMNQPTTGMPGVAVPWPMDARLTIGNIPVASITGKTMADRLGWAHIRQCGAASDYYIIATGGGSGYAENKGTSISDGDEVRNAMDVRYVYYVKYIAPPAPASGYSISLLNAATTAYINATYW